MFAVSLGLFDAANAQAWQLDEATWPVEAGPVLWCISDDGTSGFDAGIPLEAARRAVAMYAATGIAFEEVGLCPAEPAGLLAFAFGGSTAGSSVIDKENSVIRGTCTYDRTTSYTVAISGGPDEFAMPEEIESACTDEADLVGVLAHGTGHALGLAHSCERDQPCVDPAALAALMYWAPPSCTVGLLTPDDEAGLSALFSVCGGSDPADDVEWEIADAPDEEPKGCQSAGAGSTLAAWIALAAIRRRPFRLDCRAPSLPREV